MNKTRDQKFQESFRHYIMNDLCINDIVYSLDYSLTNQTVNKSRCEHTYKLQIFGNIESMFHTGENVVEILPTTHEFITYMKEFFASFELKNENITQKLSYIHFHTLETQDTVSEIIFDVVYHKDHLPFPRMLTETENLQREINGLQGEINRYERKNNRLIRKLSVMKNTMREIQNRVQTKLLDMLTSTTPLDIANQTCPVCYESFEKETIQIPLCFHYICTDCKDRCTNCPLCREDYV